MSKKTALSTHQVEQGFYASLIMNLGIIRRAKEANGVYAPDSDGNPPVLNQDAQRVLDMLTATEGIKFSSAHHPVGELNRFLSAAGLSFVTKTAEGSEWQKRFAQATQKGSSDNEVRDLSRELLSMVFTPLTMRSVTGDEAPAVKTHPRGKRLDTSNWRAQLTAVSIGSGEEDADFVPQRSKKNKAVPGLAERQKARSQLATIGKDFLEYNRDEYRELQRQMAQLLMPEGKTATASFCRATGLSQAAVPALINPDSDADPIRMPALTNETWSKLRRAVAKIYDGDNTKVTELNELIKEMRRVTRYDEYFHRNETNLMAQHEATRGII